LIALGAKDKIGESEELQASIESDSTSTRQRFLGSSALLPAEKATHDLVVVRHVVACAVGQERYPRRTPASFKGLGMQRHRTTGFKTGKFNPRVREEGRLAMATLYGIPLLLGTAAWKKK
jgi:hypothetical protein